MQRRLAFSGIVGAANFVVVCAVYHFVRFRTAVFPHVAILYGALFGVIGALVFFLIWPSLREHASPEPH